MSGLPVRSVLVTGASTGIGEACAVALDALGFRVYAGIRDPADGERLRGRGSERLVPLRLDVCEADSIRDAAERVADETGKGSFAGLVNNAGIAVAAPLEFVPLDALRRQLEVNVVGQVAVTQAFLPLLRRGGGRIVNMGSISGRFANPFLGPYAASKFALEAITDSLRVELRPWKIHVAIVEPGVVATPIWRKSLASADELIAAMPPEAHRLYGAPISALRSLVEGIGGFSASRVSKAVVHALTSPRPRARYPVGGDARIALGISHLPTRLRDWLVASRLEKRGAGGGKDT